MQTFLFLDLGLALLAAHMVADFLFQPDWMVKRKGVGSVLLLHCLIVAGVSYLFAGRWSLWQAPLWVFVTHALIDRLKVRSGRNTTFVFLADQLAHVLVIAALGWALHAGRGVSEWTQQWGTGLWRVWIWTIGIILCIRVGGIMVGFWVKPYLDEIEEARREDGAAVKASRGLTNGGRIIGQLERVLIFLFVGLGQLGAIGFLVAAKSIFRFGELKDRGNRMEAEYITIGTLLSFSWAIVVAYVTFWIAARV